MSRNGGYIIIDLKTSEVFTSGEPRTIEGVYKSVNNPYNKPSLISGLVVGDIIYPDFFAPFIPGTDSMTTTVVIGGSNVTISVTDKDVVTVTVSSEE